MVDPVPQALVLTSIVIGFGVTALALTLVMRIYASHGSIDTKRLGGLKW
jgi:multicomponent Na+:H+ antiporter subunit C